MFKFLQRYYLCAFLITRKVKKMSTKFRGWGRITILVGVIMIASALFVLAWNSYLILFTNSLQVSEFNVENGDYSADVLDDGNRVADFFVRFPRLVYGELTEIPTRISIWHEQGAKLKSLRLIFSSSDFLSIALEVPEGYPWPNIEFHRTSDSRGALFYVADLGIQGTGTVTLDFFVEMQSNRQRLDLNVYFQITMQKEAPLTFSREVAEAQVDIQTFRA